MGVWGWREEGGEGGGEGGREKDIFFPKDSTVKKGGPSVPLSSDYEMDESFAP